MSDTTDKPDGPHATYELTYQPDGTSFTVRENLVDILQRELLGPIHGPHEVLPLSPRSQYLIGHIAPVKLTGAALTDDDTEPVAERGISWRPAPTRRRCTKAAACPPTPMTTTPTPRTTTPKTAPQAGLDDPRVDGSAVSGAAGSGVVHRHRVVGRL